MNSVRGFTLIEVMIAALVVSILAAIAYPAYTSQVEKSRRETAKASLLVAAQMMERHYAINYTYAGATTGEEGLILDRSPEEGRAFYNISLADLSATTYTVRATPIAGGPQEDDQCGILTINQAGEKTAENSGCW